MSAAHVRFFDLEGKASPPAQAQTFSFRCPKAQNNRDSRCSGLVIADTTTLKRNGQRQDGGVPQWEWDGNRSAPTFSPSIDCGGCWHGYIRAGRCVDTSGKDEPEPGG